MNSSQLKRIVRILGKVSKPLSFFSAAKKRTEWRNTIITKLSHASAAANTEDSNEAAINHLIACEFLQQWLMNNRRTMLMDYLDPIDVDHKMGETEVNFLATVDGEKLLAEATELSSKHNPSDIAAYLKFIDFQQDSETFADWKVPACESIVDEMNTDTVDKTQSVTPAMPKKPKKKSKASTKTTTAKKTTKSKKAASKKSSSKKTTTKKTTKSAPKSKTTTSKGSATKKTASKKKTAKKATKTAKKKTTKKSV